MLRMVGSNSGDFVCTQVLHNLWKLFLCKKFILREMKNGKSLNDTYKNDKVFIFDLNYEPGVGDPNPPTDFEDEKPDYYNDTSATTAQRKVPSKNYKMTSNNYSKKKKFFSKLFSDNSAAKSAHGYNKPVRHISNLTARGDSSSCLKDDDVRRFQSIKRVVLVKKPKASPVI